MQYAHIRIHYIEITDQRKTPRIRPTVGSRPFVRRFYCPLFTDFEKSRAVKPSPEREEERTMMLDQPVAWAEARWYGSLRLRKERAPAA